MIPIFPETALRADTVSSTESGRTVQRYIRLTYLIPQLLKLVDDERIAFSVGVELSYLDIYEQQDVFEAVELEDKTPSLSQAIQMKKLSQKGILDTDLVFKIISENKPNQREKISLNYDDIKKFFPKQYTVKDIEQRIKKLVEEDYHKRIRKRERDAR